MKINVTCPTCGAPLRFEARSAGKPVACNACGARFTMPGSAESSGGAAEVSDEAVESAGDSGNSSLTELPRRLEREFPAMGAEERPVKSAPPVPVETGRSLPAERSQPRSGQKRAVEPPAEASLFNPMPKLDMEELIDMTAMVDIVFFLLIFFLVTSIKQIDSTIPMPAPSAPSAANGKKAADDNESPDAPSVVVRIDQNDAIWVEDVEVRGERDLMLKLAQLRGSAGGNAEGMMVIGHGDASHGMTVMVLDAGRQAGLEHIRLSVQDEAE